MESDKHKITLVGFMILMLLTLSAGISVYVVMLDESEAMLSKSLQSSLKSGSALLEASIANAVNNAYMMATRPFIVDNLTRINRDPGDRASMDTLNRIAQSFVSPNKFSAVAYYDAKGRELASAGRFMQNSDQLILKNGASLLWKNEFIMHVRAPVLGEDGKRIGSIVTETDLLPLNSAIADMASLGRTSEFALCGALHIPNAMDCYLRRISGNRFQRLDRIVEDKALPMNYALEGKTGAIFAKDYRRQDVVAAYAPLADTGLGLVLKMDQSELYGPVTGQLKYIAIILAAFVMLGALMLSWMVSPLVQKLIDSRKKVIESNEALQRANEKSLLLLRNASDGIHILDSDGNLIECSDSFCDMLGYSREEMIGMNVSHWDASFSESGLREALMMQFSGQERTLFETRHKRKNGKIIDVEVSAYPLELEGKPVLFNSARDITERRKSEAMIRIQSNALNASTDGIAIADARASDLPLVYVNHAFEEITGYSEEELLGRNCRYLQGEDKDQPELEMIRASLRDGRSGRATLRNYRKDGSLFWNRLHIAPVRDEQGKLTHFLGVINDVTERRDADEYLRMVSSVFHHADEGIVITDTNAKILEVNPAFTIITGYEREEVLGKNPNILRSGKHDREFYEGMWHKIIEEGHWTGEIWNKRKNGEIYPERLILSAVKNDEGETVRYVALFSDISDIKNHQQQLERMAQHDVLTGLPNRMLLNDRLDMAIAQAQRSGDKLAVCFMDLDGFKLVNDNLGHEAGDLLLIEVARRLISASRATDTVARLGGDEFVLVFSNFSDEAECLLLVSRIKDEIGQPYHVQGNEVRISASMGVAIYPDTNADGSGLLRYADQAMYKAKQGGRNRVQFFNPEAE